MKRLLRHLVSGPARVRRTFPAAALAAIEAAVARSEAGHGGQIQVAMEGALAPLQLLRGMSPRQRALEVFARLHVWDTEHNNGVLIYVLLADRAVEIVADRHIHARAGAATWRRIAQGMELDFARQRYSEGLLAGIAAVGAELARHYPAAADGGNELPDAPALL